MAPFFPNGIYEISNVGSNDQIAELGNGIPFGPIVGAPCSGNPIQRWIITNIGDGGNQITIENVASPGTFANARQIQGGNLVGAPAKTVWTVVKVDRGFYIQSPDANFVWQLPAPDAPIVLVRHTAQDNTRWEFILISR